jgi:hypothetical protein
MGRLFKARLKIGIRKHSEIWLGYLTKHIVYMQPDVSAVEAGQGPKYSWWCKQKANGRHVHILTESCEKIYHVSKICSEKTTL